MLASLSAKSEPKSKGPLFQVTSESEGIGDHLLALAMANGLRHKMPGAEVIYSADPCFYQWLALFDGADSFSPELLADVPVFCCEHSNCWGTFTAKGKSRWQHWEEDLGWPLVVPEAKPFKQEIVKASAPLCGRVVLVPFAAYPERTWPLDRWLQVERLLIEQGLRCVVLDTERERCMGFASPRVINANASYVAVILKGSICFAGNDSGLAHLAGMFHVPGVVVCSAASDANIVAYAKTLRELGGRWNNCINVHPQHVVDAIVERIISAVSPEFSLAKFSEVLYEGDRKNQHRWFPIYSTLYQVVRNLQPKRIVEIGVRAGYSAWTMLQACPEVYLVGIDNESDINPTEYPSGARGASEHAREIMRGQSFDLIVEDSHSLSGIPECDLAYIDADHSSSGCYQDLVLARKSGAKALLVDDYSHIKGVRDACEVFLQGHDGWQGKYIPSPTGLFLLQRKGS